MPTLKDAAKSTDFALSYHPMKNYLLKMIFVKIKKKVLKVL